MTKQWIDLEIRLDDVLAHWGGPILAIAALDQNWTIGKGDRLAYSVAEDMAWFKSMTAGSFVLVGRRTAEQILGQSWAPGCWTKSPLPHREVLIASGGTVWAQEKALSSRQMLWVAGGQSVYAQSLPYCKQLLLSQIRPIDCVSGSDLAKFPTFTNDFDLKRCTQATELTDRSTGQPCRYWQETWVRKQEAAV